MSPIAPEFTHHLLPGPAGDLHAVECGAGPLVLLLHGFPERWSSWRHQLAALGAAGYRAVAIDVRGYGTSARPDAVEAYRMLAHVADNVAVVHALGERTAAVVGHDWGSPIAAASAQLRPDVFTAVGLLGVPYTPRGPVRPTDAFAAIGGDEQFYVSYFQRPGLAEAEIEQDLRSWLRGFYVALSGETPTPQDLFTVPPGGAMRDRFPTTEALPAWLSEAELDDHAADLERGGLSGPLNRYRNVDRDWEDLAAFDDVPIRQPSIYIAGSLDPSTAWLSEAIRLQATWLPGLSGTHLIDGAGHWVQQERPDEVNDLLLDWLRSAGA